MNLRLASADPPSFEETSSNGPSPCRAQQIHQRIRSLASPARARCDDLCDQLMACDAAGKKSPKVAWEEWFDGCKEVRVTEGIMINY